MASLASATIGPESARDNREAHSAQQAQHQMTIPLSKLGELTSRRRDDLLDLVVLPYRWLRGLRSGGSCCRSTVHAARLAEDLHLWNTTETCRFESARTHCADSCSPKCSKAGRTRTAQEVVAPAQGQSAQLIAASDDIHAVMTVMRGPRLLVVLPCLLPVRSEVVKCDLSEMVPAHICINWWDVNRRRQRVITALSECRTLNDLASRRSADTMQQMARLASIAARTQEEETSAVRFYTLITWHMASNTFWTIIGSYSCSC